MPHKLRHGLSATDHAFSFHCLNGRKHKAFADKNLHRSDPFFWKVPNDDDPSAALHRKSGASFPTSHRRYASLKYEPAEPIPHDIRCVRRFDPDWPSFREKLQAPDVPGFPLKLPDPRDGRYCTPTAGDHEKPKTPCAHGDSQDNPPRHESHGNQN